MNIRSKNAWIYTLALACLAGPCARTFAEGNIDTTNKYAWSENAGWANFAPTNGGVTVLVARSGYLSGYVWAENIGWIKMGNDNGGPYQNTLVNNWGVNLVVGKLDGYAWSENCGWIKFNPTHGEVTINVSDGKFDGYAWAENIGWIHFQNASPVYYVRTLGRSPSGTIISTR